MKMCPKCGGLKTYPGELTSWGGTFCHCTEIQPSLTAPLIFHIHCFCIEKEIKGKKHNECCMCGERKLA